MYSCINSSNAFFQFYLFDITGKCDLCIHERAKLICCTVVVGLLMLSQQIGSSTNSFMYQQIAKIQIAISKINQLSQNLHAISNSNFPRNFKICFLTVTQL